MRTWTPSSQTLNRMENRATRLIKGFDDHLAAFDPESEGSGTFGGPSLYFHYRCGSLFHHLPVEVKLRDDRFFEYVYATLVSWGMHRMGKTSTKLKDFEELKAEVLREEGALVELARLDLSTFDPVTSPAEMAELVRVVDSMRISKSDAHLVANTKVLHHILPNLIPPIDRRYTLEYFGLDTMLPSYFGAGAIFEVLFPVLARVGRAFSERALRKVDLTKRNWHTSLTKVIDNVIITAVISENVDEG